jgi:hypothetical protein
MPLVAAAALGRPSLSGRRDDKRTWAAIVLADRAVRDQRWLYDLPWFLKPKTMTIRTVMTTMVRHSKHQKSWRTQMDESKCLLESEEPEGRLAVMWSCWLARRVVGDLQA